MSNKPMPEPDETFPVEWEKDKDMLFAAIQLVEGASVEEVLSLPQMSIDSVKKTEIQRFCAGCQNLNEDGICRLGRHDQLRYVARKWCGWASKDGKRGQMTKDGFK